ncbi:BolA family protein [Candidatus Njordibacter sp. Uisw_039]|jgi:BolA protein|uniref:BolA family protein n=1 Tax=Candidatus Njordibacter sp. Uisw_039 TaxID=3230972 RepID=UPI003A12AE10|tara:strand:+ start:311 stop:652 length:342 start_codon:yes stop_codon:yes gene_type:complete
MFQPKGITVDATANKLLEMVLTPLNVSHHQLVNDSQKHSGSATDSHYNLVLVSDDFAGIGPVKRHQQVYALVGELMNNPIHALALHCYTADQWQAKQEKMPATAPCMGANKAS